MKEIEIDEEKEIESLKTYIVNQVRNGQLPDLLKCFEVLTMECKSLDREMAKKYLTKGK